MKLNFGCGRDVMPGYVNADIAKLPGVEKVFDFNKFPYPFRDSTFDEALISHVLEHLGDVVKVMGEIHRICKKGAVVRILVPYFHHHTAFQDPQHKHFFTLDSFDYFTADFKFNFYGSARFKVLKKQLKPSWLGRFIPLKRVLLNMLAMIFGELAQEIYFELEVVK